jgi:hypothetical protein
MLLVLNAVGLASYFSVGSWLLIRLLREKYAASVQVIWYLFALAFHISLLFLWWASASLAIDSNGKPNGSMGELVVKLMNTMIDLKMDVQVMAALASLVVFPQVFSYLCSAAFGCASRPKLVAVTADWLSWGVTKSFSVTSAILTAITIWGAARGWHGFDTEELLGYLNLSSMLLLLSFSLLLIKSEIAEIPSLIKRNPSSAVAKAAFRFHRWATRHRKDSSFLRLSDQSAH